MIPIALKKWLGIPHSCKEPSSIFVGLIGGVGDLVSAAPSIAALVASRAEMLAHPRLRLRLLLPLLILPLPVLPLLVRQ